MTSDDVRQIEQRMKDLDDHALLRLVAAEESDYRSEVLDITRAELRRRRLNSAHSQIHATNPARFEKLWK